MIDVESYIFERVFNKLNKAYPSIAITDEELYTPPHLPCVSVVLADSSRYEEGNDSSGKENFTTIMVECSVYTEGKNKKKLGKEIFGVLDNEMAAIGLNRTSYNVLTQYNSSINRIVARYTAICGKNNDFYWR